MIDSADKVIINGDFWDSWCISFEKFINSKWQELFSLLLAKDTVYIYGNHDPKHLCDERCSMFSVKVCDSYQFESLGKKFHCEHGHQLMTGFDVVEFINLYNKFLHRNPKLLCYTIAKLERAAFSLFPKTGTHSRVGRRINRILRKNLDHNFINIFGHSHYPVLDLKNNYINTGSIMCKNASYVVIDDKGLSLENKRY